MLTITALQVLLVKFILTSLMLALTTLISASIQQFLTKTPSDQNYNSIVYNLHRFCSFIQLKMLQYLIFQQKAYRSIHASCTQTSVVALINALFDTYSAISLHPLGFFSFLT